MSKRLEHVNVDLQLSMFTRDGREFPGFSMRFPFDNMKKGDDGMYRIEPTTVDGLEHMPTTLIFELTDEGIYLHRPYGNNNGFTVVQHPDREELEAYLKESPFAPYHKSKSDNGLSPIIVGYNPNLSDPLLFEKLYTVGYTAFQGVEGKYAMTTFISNEKASTQMMYGEEVFPLITFKVVIYVPDHLIKKQKREQVPTKFTFPPEPSPAPKAAAAEGGRAGGEGAQGGEGGMPADDGAQNVPALPPRKCGSDDTDSEDEPIMVSIKKQRGDGGYGA